MLITLHTVMYYVKQIKTPIKIITNLMFDCVLVAKAKSEYGFLGAGSGKITLMSAG
jgi:hypothetical protein